MVRSRNREDEKLASRRNVDPGFWLKLPLLSVPTGDCWLFTFAATIKHVFASNCMCQDVQRYRQAYRLTDVQMYHDTAWCLWALVTVVGPAAQIIGF